MYNKHGPTNHVSGHIVFLFYKCVNYPEPICEVAREGALKELRPVAPSRKLWTRYIRLGCIRSSNNGSVFW